MKLEYISFLAIGSAAAQSLDGVAQDAFIYGAPSIAMFSFRAGLLSASAGLAYNRFFMNPISPEGYFQALFTNLYHRVPGSNLFPNADVVYSAANINLGTPKMITVPAFASLGRFSSLEIFDMYTNIPFIASNLTHPNGARVVIFGPQTSLSQAKLNFPDATEYVPCNTVDLAAFIRVQIFNSSAAEMLRAKAVQNQYSITPHTSATEGLAVVNSIKSDLNSMGLTLKDVSGLFPTQCNQTGATAQKCWKIIGQAMKTWPIQTPEAVTYTEPFAQIGLSQTTGFNSPVDSNAQAALRQSNIPDVGLATNPKVSKLVTTFSTNWQTKTAFSRTYNLTSDDLLLRAAVGSVLPNPPEQAVYYILKSDSTGSALQGGATYSLKFPEGQLPPVNAFWSVTVYDITTGAFVGHTLEHSVSSTEGFSQAEDGSVEIIFSTKKPKTLQKGQNWLQITSSGTGFLLTLRAYMPQLSVLNLSYMPPAVLRV